MIKLNIQVENRNSFHLIIFNNKRIKFRYQWIMILSVNIKKAKQYETMNYFIIHLSTQGLNLFCHFVH